MSNYLEHGRALLQVQRFDEAASQLTKALAADPQDYQIHALLACAHLGAKRFEEATQAAHNAIQVEPDAAYAHFVLGTVLCQRDRDKEALVAAREALRLNPDDSDYHALAASCCVGSSQWRRALSYAESGLKLDPTHVRCLNLRAISLQQLGQHDDASAALDLSLAESPENPDTHTAYGWACLHKGEYQRSLEHFREALRLDPEQEAARAGLVEALKAKNPLYRPILWWLLFISRLTGKQAIVFILGIYFGQRLLRVAAEQGGGLAYIAWPLLILSVLAIWTSWVGQPLFDFMLWLRRDTRAVLTDRDRRIAVCVGAATLAAPLAGGIFYFLGDLAGALLSAITFLFIAIPIAGGLNLPNRKARLLGGIIAAGFALTCVVACVWRVFEVMNTEGIALMKNSGALPTLLIVMVGARVSTWILLGLSFVKVKR